MVEVKILDPGHRYLIEALDGGEDQIIQFVKRVGPNYPGNQDPVGGPITQEFIRAILDRCKYVNNQEPCIETETIISSLRTILMMFEVRAARCRGTAIELSHDYQIDNASTCPKCGHIQCDPERHNQPHWGEK
jgi:predicted Zn-ribbon and HTH transcriptional regulator